MNVKNTKKADKRVDIGYLSSLGIQAYGHNNLYPQELRAIIEDSASQLFIMRDNEHIMGMLTLGHYTSPTGRKVWVEDVVVSAEYRGEGLGRKLINHAIEYCRENLSPCTLMLTSNPARVAANELYRTSGFEPKQTNVYKMTF